MDECHFSYIFAQNAKMQQLHSRCNPFESNRHKHKNTIAPHHGISEYGYIYFNKYTYKTEGKYAQNLSNSVLMEIGYDYISFEL